MCIVGGGFSGITACTQVYEIHENEWGNDFHLQSIEKEPANWGGGIAYGEAAANRNHVINIQAPRMSSDPDYGSDFENWLRENHPDIYQNNPNAVPRAYYNEYLLNKMEDRVTRSDGVTRDVKYDQVVDVNPVVDGVELVCRSGDRVFANHVGLATGHTAARTAPFYSRIKGHPNFLPYQWGRQAQNFFDKIQPTAKVFIVGTSMSADDALVDLETRGFMGSVVQMSRNGYKHFGYTKYDEPNSNARAGFPSFVYDAAYESGSAPKLSKIFNTGHRINSFNNWENDVIQNFIQGLQNEWNSVVGTYHHFWGKTITGEEFITAFERHIPDAVETLLNAGVSKDTLKRLLKNNQSLINTNRVGVSYKIDETRTNMELMGQLDVRAASINDIIPNNDNSFTVYYTPKGSFETLSETFDYVISSLGPEMDYTKTQDPLWKNLLRKGLATPHWTDMGVNIGHDGQLVDSNGIESQFITAVGTMAAGSLMTDKRSYEAAGIGPIVFSVGGLRKFIPHAAQHMYNQIQQYTL